MHDLNTTCRSVPKRLTVGSETFKKSGFTRLMFLIMGVWFANTSLTCSALKSSASGKLSDLDFSVTGHPPENERTTLLLSLCKNRCDDFVVV